MAVLTRAQPEVDALSALLREADQQRRSSIAQARSGRVAIEQGVDAVLPQVAATEQALQLDRHAPNTTFGNVLNQQRAAARQDLLDRRSGASVGEAAQRRAAQDTYRGDVGKVQQSQVDLARRVAQEIAVMSGQLRREDVDRQQRQQQIRQSERSSIRSSGIDPDTGAPIAGGPLDITDPRDYPAPKPGPTRLPGGAKLATVQQHGSFKDAVGGARAALPRLRAEGRSRAEIAQVLLNGRPQATLRVDEKGNKLDAPVTIPGVSKRPELVASIALDLELDGHVSRRNVRELHKRGLSLKKLGLPSRPNATKQATKAVKGLFT